MVVAMVDPPNSDLAQSHEIWSLLDLSEIALIQQADFPMTWFDSFARRLRRHDIMPRISLQIVCFSVKDKELNRCSRVGP
jgi:hypothetical protein